MEKYDVISMVGEGSYGLVMRCRHRESGQYVAIKKFLETEDDPTVRKMAIREIRMLKKLRHENLVNLIEVFRRKRRYFLVFEYLEHTILEELEARAGGLGFIISRKYIYQILRALDFIHLHDVIHRDIKPENVLVSRLGVIKLCDFGFARPYAENETFTDYVATRWYRSPELLVGDPRYGKEVDIWAVGCLYSEMMTGEPLFPGESDIDQLFQIVRVLGKLNSRHQILVTRNTIFKGMKQEQNTSLHELFPDWNRDCLDFLSQCLKMDGNLRPNTTKLLKHELFTRDNFLEIFLVELRMKINKELQGNPLLKRISNNSGSGGGGGVGAGAGQRHHQHHQQMINNDMDKKIVNKYGNKQSGGGTGTDDQRNSRDLIDLSLVSTQLLQTNNSKSYGNIINSGGGGAGGPGAGLSGDNRSNIDELINLNLKSYQNTNGSHQKSKGISINNLVFKDDGGRYTRAVSAKPNQKLNLDKVSLHNNDVASDLQVQSPSPVEFQSLQVESMPTMEVQQKRLSPISVNNLSINGGNIAHYFGQKRSTNVLGLQNVSQKTNTRHANPKSDVGQRNGNHFNKRDKGSTYYTNSTLPNTIVDMGNSSESIKEISSVLPTTQPSWLTTTGNNKTQQTKSNNHQISGVSGAGAKRNANITYWKNLGPSNNINETSSSSNRNDILLPTCPGAVNDSQDSNSITKKKQLQDNFFFGAPISD